MERTAVRPPERECALVPIDSLSCAQPPAGLQFPVLVGNLDQSRCRQIADRTPYERFVPLEPSAPKSSLAQHPAYLFHPRCLSCTCAKSHTQQVDLQHQGVPEKVSDTLIPLLAC